MKIWTSEHIFSHPWDTVVKASFRKYPNPLNTAVKGIDVIDREVKQDGTLQSHRIITSEWGLPKWISNILGLTSSKICYASEFSTIDPFKKEMTLKTRNLTFCKELSVEEKLTYFPDPTQPNQTLLKQEAMITVHGIPLSSYIEDIITSTISTNADKGRQAMEFVINKLNIEMQEVRDGISKSVDDLKAQVKRSIPEEIDIPHAHFNFAPNFSTPKS